MSRKPVVHEDEYQTESGQVRLSVIVGERQFGTSVVFIDDKLIANGDIDELKLGEGPDIRGRELVIYTLVTDVRENTDDVAVTWTLYGGEHRISATETAKLSKSFASQMFKGIFHLR